MEVDFKIYMTSVSLVQWFIDQKQKEYDRRKEDGKI